jgi:hypothetical protein
MAVGRFFWTLLAATSRIVDASPAVITNTTEIDVAVNTVTFAWGSVTVLTFIIDTCVVQNNKRVLRCYAVSITETLDTSERLGIALWFRIFAASVRIRVTSLAPAGVTIGTVVTVSILLAYVTAPLLAVFGIDTDIGTGACC